MKNYILALIFFAATLLAEDIQVKSIKLEGNDKFFTTVLKEVVGVEEPSFYKFWKKSHEYTVEELEEIKTNIIDFYQSKGFFNVKTELEIKEQTAIFKITENERMRVSSVEMDSPFYIKNMIALKPNDHFDADDFVKSKENIKRYLEENGYPKSKFNAKAFIDTEKYEARLEFNITDVQKSTFGKINIAPLETVDNEHIEDKLLFKSNQRFDIRKVEESYKNLYATGAFESVSIKQLETNDDTVPMDVNLTLGKQKTFKIGVGYDTDEGARIKAGWMHKNFGGNLKRFEAITEVSGIRQNVGAKLTVPRVFGLEFEDMAKYEKVKYPGFKENILSNTFKFKLPYKTTSHSLGLLTEKGSVKAEDISDYINDQDFFINALVYEYALDRRDSILDAKKGYFIGWNTEVSDNMLGSNINYLKMNLEARQIISFDDGSLFRDFLFAAKANVGGINDFKKDDIPVFKRYFAGGSFSNRGYGYRRLGKKDDHGNYVGGNSLMDYSFEARYKTTKSFWSVLFFDTTLLNEKSLAFNGEYKPSVGAGIRYNTIVGPIRVDIGVPLREEKKSPVFHISFGQAF
jgi:outer membrane protein assembly complex protein YaeT